LFLQASWGGKKMISLGSWEEEGKYNGNLIIVLEEWR